jgi:hypothetical protein
MEHLQVSGLFWAQKLQFHWNSLRGDGRSPTNSSQYGRRKEAKGNETEMVKGTR